MKRVAYIGVCLALVVLTTTSLVGAEEPTLMAVPASVGPTLDGAGTDAAWVEANALTVHVSGGKAGEVDVTLKAVYSASDVYMLLEWADETMSIDKKMWSLDGSEWSQTGNEDRFAILWNIDDSIAQFNTAGCTVVCHTKMSTNSAAEFGDMWHWKAARSNPVGYVDDKYLNNTGDADDGGRHGDGGDSTYSDNKDEDGNGAPDYAWASTAPSAPSAVSVDLAERFLLKDEELAYSATNPLTGASWAPGDTVPGYRLREPGGSRSDVEAYGVWANGVWTVEVKRALDTGANALKEGEKVDQVFDLTETYHFGLAIMDDTGSGHSVSAAPIALTFAQPMLPVTGDEAEALSPYVVGGAMLLVVAVGVLLWARKRQLSTQ